MIRHPVPTIRTATPFDAAAITAISRQVQAMHAAAHPAVFKPVGEEVFPPAIVRELMAVPENRFYVAVVDGEVVGFIFAAVQEQPASQWKHAARVMAIDQMGVRADCRGRGVGSGLLEAAHGWAAELGIQEVRLSVWTFNEDARRFYDRHGYVVAQEHRVRISPPR